MRVTTDTFQSLFEVTAPGQRTLHGRGLQSVLLLLSPLEGHSDGGTPESMAPLEGWVKEPIKSKARLACLPASGLNRVETQTRNRNWPIAMSVVSIPLADHGRVNCETPCGIQGLWACLGMKDAKGWSQVAIGPGSHLAFWTNTATWLPHPE